MGIFAPSFSSRPGASAVDDGGQNSVTVGCTGSASRTVRQVPWLAITSPMD